MAVISHVWTWVTGKRVCATNRGEGETYRSYARKAGVPPEVYLQDAERRRELFWQKNPKLSSEPLRRRALIAARYLSLRPAGAVLELGAGSGRWTQQLSATLGGENPITAGVFNKDLLRTALARELPNIHFAHIKDIENQFPPRSFDYVVATDVLTEKLCSPVLSAAYRWLKPGGQVVFFAHNASNPLTCLKQIIQSAARPGYTANWRAGIHRDWWAEQADCLGFSQVEIMPWEVLRPRSAKARESIAVILEHAPVIRKFSKTVSFRAVKPGGVGAIPGAWANLANHKQLFGAVSVVVPCHNEEANVERLVKTLLAMYGHYIHEILIVDDNSVDRTAEIAETLAGSEPRVKLVRRKPPSGVGRALREGYAAAGGQYILSMDCDFIHIAQEFRPMFDAVAEGYDGAIGSRFSSESVLIRYPFLKILCNRGFHLILNLLLGKQVRDISNNLKLYRADILKNLDIEEDHFAANAETGLKPVLLGYRIQEVPTSWINRAEDMGKSSFNIVKVGPDYFFALCRMTWRAWRGRYRASQLQRAAASTPGPAPKTADGFIGATAEIVTTICKHQ